jgi:hypothetical protein
VNEVDGKAQRQVWNLENKDFESSRKIGEFGGGAEEGGRQMRLNEQGAIRIGDYTVHYSGDERVERGVAIVVHKGMLRRYCVMTNNFS